MIKRIGVPTLGLCVLMLTYFASVPSQPSFNGDSPGCGPNGGCHTFQSSIVSVQSLGNLQVSITLTGGTGRVAGELVDSAGTVVAVNNSTNSNPFILTAPHTGRFTVNAGFKNPQRRWDSTQIVLSLTGVDDGEEGSPKTGYTLNQNYPNPFNPSTVIDFVLPHSTSVTLKVFSIDGQEVKTLLSERMHLGRHSVRLDATGLASGIYFYQLQTDDFTQMKKMIVLK